MAAQQQQESDNSMSAIWITVGCFIVFGFIWYYFSAQIVAFVFDIRRYEIDVIAVFVPSGWAKSLDAARKFILDAKAGGYEGVTVTNLVDVSLIVGNYLRYPVALVIAGLGFFIYIGNPIAKYKHIYTMKSLLAVGKKIWPQVTPVASLDLINSPIDKGPWAMAQRPMDFARKNNILIIEKQEGKSRFELRVPVTASINRDAARRLFALQLGRYWSSPDALPDHARALFAIFAARVNGDRDGAAKLLDHISTSSGTGTLSFSGMDALLEKHKNNKYIIRLTGRHAFEVTVMASMLEFARQDGVVASADFLWLKPMDRRLWYMLNCIGRQTPFCEVAGAYAHWIAENEFGKRLNVPMVEEAVNALELAVKEIIYHEDESEETEAEAEKED